MSAKELREWEIYLTRVEPQGQERQDLMLAQIAQIVAQGTEQLTSVWAGKKYRAKRYRLRDFMPDWDEALKPREPVEIPMENTVAIVAALNKAMGGIDIRKSKETKSPDGHTDDTGQQALP